VSYICVRNAFSVRAQNLPHLFLCASRRERKKRRRQWTNGFDKAELEEAVLMAEPGEAGGEAPVAAAAPVAQARGRVRNIYRARPLDPLKVLAKARLAPFASAALPAPVVACSDSRLLRTTCRQRRPTRLGVASPAGLFPSPPATRRDGQAPATAAARDRTSTLCA